MKNLYVLLLCMCSLAGFAQPNPIEIKIDPKNMPEGDLRMSDLIESIEYIPLETTDESILDDNLVYDLNDNHVVAGYYNGEAVCLFNHKGKFVRTIGQKGAGPEEYLYISQLFIDPNNRYIIVIDGLKKIYYNMEGKFLYSSPLSVDNRDRKNELFFREQFLRVAESYLYRDSSYYVFEIEDAKGKIIKQAVRSVLVPKLDNKEFRLSFATHNIDCSYVYKNEPHVREVLNDTIYRIDGVNNFIPKYVIHLGKYKITPDMQGNVTHYWELTENCFVIKRIVETSRYLLMDCAYKNNKLYCYYDKQKKRMFRFLCKTGFPNDFDGGVNMDYPEQENNMFHTYFPVEQFLDSQQQSKLEPRGPQSAVRAFEKLVKKVDPDDNPIIMIVKLKE